MPKYITRSSKLKKENMPWICWFAYNSYVIITIENKSMKIRQYNNDNCIAKYLWPEKQKTNTMMQYNSCIFVMYINRVINRMVLYTPIY